MTGLYSPINKLMEQVTRPKGTGAEYMAELQKKPGYKPAEAEDRDLQTLMALPQMQRAEFMEKLKAQANKYPLKMRELTGRQTHHDRYTLPGGENYREILLHTPMPEGEGFPGVEHHFGGTPNILASIMAKDRVNPGEMGYTLRNKKSGFKGQHYKTAEEAQAAVQGYPEHLRPMLDVVPNQGPSKKILHLEEIQSDWHQQGRERGYGDANLQKQMAEIKAQRKQLDADYWKQAAELKNDPQAYLRLAPTKEKMAALTKQLERLEEDKEHVVPYGPHAKDWHELALKAMIQHAAENGYDQIAVTPGQVIADRYGIDPKGMKGFYDKMVPTSLNKFGKKHGVQVQPGSVPIVSTPAQHHGMTEDQFQAQSPDEQQRMVRQHAYAYQGAKTEAPVHTFDITPAMREDVVKNGIPRYADGGDVNDSDRMTPRSRGRASFGAAPRGNRIIKEMGGNWIGGSVEDALKSLRRRTAGGMEPTEALAQMKKAYPAETTDPALTRRQVPIVQGLEQDASLNNWIDRNLANYVKKQMATKDDPVRGLFEQGVTHVDTNNIGIRRYKAPQMREEQGQPQLGQSEAGRAWEDATDAAVNLMPINELHKDYKEPWMEKADPNTKTALLNNHFDVNAMGFDHIVDVLKEDLAEGRIRPDQLNKISMEQAVRRAHAYNEEQAKKMRETTVKATEGMPVHKEYDTGHKWIELAKPEAKQAMTPDEADEKYAAMYAAGKPSSEAEAWMQKYRKDRDAAEKELYQKLDQALKYEGNTMGHCVGGYTADVANGNSRIFSLRDAKGEPHVTIETAPMESSDLGRHMADKKRAGASAEEIAKGFANPPQRIVQIKGKQNRAPNKEYLPMVQDFVRSGNWSDVGDAKNAGLRKYGDVFNVNEQRQIEKTGEQVPEHEWLAGEDIQRLHNAITPPGKRLKYDPYGNVTGNEGGYAKGGGVSRGTVKEKVTISPNMDVMQYELLTKKVK